MAEKIKKGVKARNAKSSKIRGMLMRLNINLRRFYKHVPETIRWILITLFAITVLSYVILFLSDLVGSSSSKKQITKEAIIKESESRVLQLAAAISSLRDTVGTDSIFVDEIKGDIPAPELFETIFHLDSIKGSRFSDIFPFLESGKYSFLKGRGVAYYDPSKHLTAWNSSKIGTANFDSVFTFASLLEKRSKLIFLDNEQIFSWIVSIRKIISKDGAMLGYVMAKAMIGERFSYGGADHPLTIFDDIIGRAGREVQFSFIRVQPDSVHAGTAYPILLEPNDSSSVVGFLTIGEVPVTQTTALQRTVTFVRDCAFSVFVLILIWLLSWYIAQGGAGKTSLVSKAMSLGGVLVFLTVGRLLLVATNSVSAIFPQSLIDPQDFALFSVFGLFANPLQLFTTILFVTTFLALAWVIYVPKNSAWNTPPVQNEEAAMFSTAGWLARITPILLMILFLPLVNMLFVSVCNVLVSNGSYHYLGNRFGFTRGSFTLMEASFLLVGVCYFFLVLLIMLLTLRSMIRITASELSPSRSYFAHYLLFTIILTLAGWLLSPQVLSIYPELYWLITTFLLCVLTVIMFSRDVAMLRSGQRDPSFFYRLPRSGLALLFLLTGAGFLLSPILATQEYANDIEIIKQNLRQNSQSSDLNYPAFLDQTFLALNGNEQSTFPASFRTSSDIKNLAFDLWLAQFSETSGKNVVIEVQDLHGAILSHFARNASKEDEARLKGMRDSLIRTLLKENGGGGTTSGSSDYQVGSFPCFTTSCTPAAIGVGFLDLSRRGDIRTQMVDSVVRTRMVVSISVWNDMFPQPVVHSLYDIARTSGASSDKLNWQDQDVFYAQYQHGFLLNASTTAIELPSHISPDIDTALTTREFVARTEIIEGNRYYSLYHSVGAQTPSGERIMAATIMIPGINSLVELTLSLNTVSLFIGFFLIFFALLLRSLFSKGKRGTLKFRDRIFLIVLTIALVPLVIVTNITRSLLVEREQKIERENLQRDAEIIAERLQRGMGSVDSVSATKMSVLLNDLSKTIGRDISLYNNHGILVATNRPELYESSLLPSQVSSDIIRRIFIRQKSFTIEPLASASGSFDIGYKIVQRSESEGVLGIVGVTSFRGLDIIESNISRTIELMYGAFAALGIILLLIGAWISVRVAAPIQQLIAATEKVTEGRLETIVKIKRKDEVGELAQAFNRMTAELERTRENVAQSEREGAWKEMARQVAHEIKNPLTPMKLSVQHVEHAYESGDTNFGSVFKRVIRTLSEQIDVLTRIATEFSRFGEMPRRKYGFVSLKKIVESAMALYDAERGRIRFVVDIPDSLPPIYADDEEFRRALVNLIRNSLQATEGWGVIIVSAREKSGLIHLKVSDTGGGMSAETLKKAFDPNFSTKTSGMGLGLAIVKKIITDMSGTISVESTLGKGTTFHIELPAREYPPE